MNAQKYNGWTNRETWLINLHGFTEAVEDHYIHDLFEPDGKICAMFVTDETNDDLYWSVIVEDYKEDFIHALAGYFQKEVEYYLDEVAPLDNVFLQDLMPDMRPYRHGGVINYMELAEHVFETIKEYAEHNGWS